LPKPPKDEVLSKKQIGERLRALRERRDLSQGQLAAMIGSHAQNVSQVERGVRGLTVQQVVKLARALKVPTDEILGEAKHATAQLHLRNGDRRFLRRIQRIRELPPAQRKALLKLLDGALGLGGQAPHQR
jgi:transcriptional regulator with XRE-family HTH domain